MLLKKQCQIGKLLAFYCSSFGMCLAVINLYERCLEIGNELVGMGGNGELIVGRILNANGWIFNMMMIYAGT